MTGLGAIEKVIVAGVCALLVAFTFLTVMTSAWWFRLDSIEVADACAGKPVPLVYRRAFYRDFPGAWQVDIWHLEDGDWQPWRGSSGPWDYQTRAAPNPARDLEWLVGADPATSHPPPGMYRLKVIVTANPGTIFSRSQAVESNPFEVRSCSS